MLVIGDSTEHDLEAECTIKERVFVELAADTIDLVVVIGVSQVDLIWGDPNDRTCGVPG
jgi:hypothetical protein